MAAKRHKKHKNQISLDWPFVLNFYLLVIRICFEFRDSNFVF